MPKDRPPSPRLTEKERNCRELFEEAEGRGACLAQLAVERDVAVGTLSGQDEHASRPSMGR